MNFETFSEIPYFSKCCLGSFRPLFEEISLELIGVSYHADSVVFFFYRLLLHIHLSDISALSPGTIYLEYLGKTKKEISN